MAAPLSLSKAKIDAYEPLGSVSILVRQNVATVRKGRDVVDVQDVTLVERTDSQSWRVTLADGRVWAVKRDKNCGCGG